MEVKNLFKHWTKVAAILLMAGALAWTIKLIIIISTNGRIIDTGAAAFLMKAGIFLLAIGSTGIGFRLSENKPTWLRILAILLSPILVFAVFLLIAQIVTPLVVSPLLEGTKVWYAQQEAPIGLAVMFFLTLGVLLFKSYKTVRS
jgi:lipoprotein signal peptidase